MCFIPRFYNSARSSGIEICTDLKKIQYHYFTFDKKYTGQYFIIDHWYFIFNFCIAKYQ